MKGANAPFVVPQPQPTPSEQIPKDWKTYTNTKYHYSFRYPKEYYVYQLADDGTSRENIVPESGAAEVSKDKNTGPIFSVWDTNYKDLDSDSIKRQFIGISNLDNIKTIEISIDRQPGYKLEFNNTDPLMVSNFYYSKNLYGKVLEITVSKDHLIANQIFSSIKFIQ